jgi:hypothetical protein
LKPAGLVRAHQFQVIDKLLFGSDFPFTTAGECIETIYTINQMAMGTNMPTVPRESLELHASFLVQRRGERPVPLPPGPICLA